MEFSLEGKENIELNRLIKYKHYQIQENFYITLKLDVPNTYVGCAVIKQ